jgi:hypothetical protein
MNILTQSLLLLNTSISCVQNVTAYMYGCYLLNIIMYSINFAITNIIISIMFINHDHCCLEVIFSF